jgi:hypothetical protein
MSHEKQTSSDLKVGLMGLGLGLIWIFIVAAFSHWLAL